VATGDPLAAVAELAQALATAQDLGDGRRRPVRGAVARRDAVAGEPAGDRVLRAAQLGALAEDAPVGRDLGGLGLPVALRALAVAVRDAAPRLARLPRPRADPAADVGGEVAAVLLGLLGGEPDEHRRGHELVVLDRAQRHAVATQVGEHFEHRARLTLQPRAAPEPGGDPDPQLDGVARACQIDSGGHRCVQARAAIGGVAGRVVDERLAVDDAVALALDALTDQRDLVAGGVLAGLLGLRTGRVDDDRDLVGGGRDAGVDAGGGHDLPFVTSAESRSWRICATR
jgi:hypothetical protein